jgi:hypothetical protein
MGLESRRLAGSQVKLSPPGSRWFCVDSISVRKSEVSRWDACSMIRKEARPGANKLKCTNVTLEFPNCRRSKASRNARVIEAPMGTALRQMRSIRNGIDAGKLATSPAASSSLPAARQVLGSRNGQNYRPICRPTSSTAFLPRSYMRCRRRAAGIETGKQGSPTNRDPASWPASPPLLPPPLWILRLHHCNAKLITTSDLGLTGSINKATQNCWTWWKRYPLGAVYHNSFRRGCTLSVSWSGSRCWCPCGQTRLARRIADTRLSTLLETVTTCLNLT